ncbi:MAG: DUF1353 domain-containing protein [Proteobacteria bacterium]|nr:DUF1353 domain-containing protein [Pseudomonadota bacterium]
MSSFTAELDVRITQKKRDERVLALLLQTFSYDVGTEGSGDTIVVPAGFETDFASIPRPLWIIEPPLGDAGKAAVLHDYLYETGERDRASADRIFLEAMAVLEVPWWKRSLMFRAVRLFGRGGYKERREIAAPPEAARPGGPA